MSTKTNYLGLTKPDTDDIVDIRVLNNNADIIDQGMQKFQEKFGSITVVETAAEMTDKDKVYVYAGSESGYKTDYWYYYKDGAWKVGRPFNSNGIKTDANLEEEGIAADAAATGRAVGELKESIDEVQDATFVKSPNIFDKNDILINKALNTTLGHASNEIIDSNGYFLSNQVWKCKKGDIIRNSTGWGVFCIYDSNDKLLGVINNGNLENTINFENAACMRFFAKNSTTYIDNFVLTINAKMPDKYINYGNISKLEELKKEIYPDNIPVIILNFDQSFSDENDNRIAIMDEYGWQPSFVGGTIDLTKKLIAKGWDLTTYWNGENTPTNNQLQSDLEACKLYVKTALNAQEENGFFNPIAWLCRQNNYSDILGKALKYYGYKLCRGGNVDGFDQNINSDFTRTNHTGIFSNNLEDVKNAINEAIKKNQAISIFTHYVVDTTEEDRGYDCLKSVYLELIDYIKDLENKGKVIVTNYRKFYEMKYPELSRENDYLREIKRMNFIESKIN